MKKERAELEARSGFRQINATTVEYRGQRFTLKGATIHTGHQNLSIDQKRRRLILMAEE